MQIKSYNPNNLSAPQGLKESRYLKVFLHIFRIALSATSSINRKLHLDDLEKKKKKREAISYR